jgi:thioredoxin-like negative regulator of GroEL
MNKYTTDTTPAEKPAPRETPVENVKLLTAEEFDTAVLQAPVPVVVDFHSVDGEACKALAPRFSAVADKFAGKVQFFRVAHATNAALAGRFGVTATPTLLFFRSGKESGERLSGNEIQRPQIKARVESLLK